MIELKLSYVEMLRVSRIVVQVAKSLTATRINVITYRWGGG